MLAGGNKPPTRPRESPLQQAAPPGSNKSKEAGVTLVKDVSKPQNKKKQSGSRSLDKNNPKQKHQATPRRAKGHKKVPSQPASSNNSKPPSKPSNGKHKKVASKQRAVPPNPQKSMSSKPNQRKEAKSAGSSLARDPKSSDAQSSMINQSKSSIQDKNPKGAVARDSAKIRPLKGSQEKTGQSSQMKNIRSHSATHKVAGTPNQLLTRTGPNKSKEPVIKNSSKITPVKSGPRSTSQSNKDRSRQSLLNHEQQRQQQHIPRQPPPNKSSQQRVVDNAQPTIQKKSSKSLKDPFARSPVAYPVQKSKSLKAKEPKASVSSGSSQPRDRKSSEVASSKMNQMKSNAQDHEQKREKGAVAMRSSRSQPNKGSKEKGGHSAEKMDPRQGARQYKSRERDSAHRPVIAQAQKSSSSKMYPSRTTTPSTGSSDKGSSKMSPMKPNVQDSEKKREMGSSRRTQPSRGSQEKRGHSAELRNSRYQGSSSQKIAPQQKSRERGSTRRPVPSPAQKSNSSKMDQSRATLPSTGSSDKGSSRMSQMKPVEQDSERKQKMGSSRRTQPNLGSQEKRGHSAEMRNLRYRSSSSQQGAPPPQSRERASTRRPVPSPAQKSSSSRMYLSRTTTPSTGSSDKGSSRMNQIKSSVQDPEPKREMGSSRRTQPNLGSQKGGHSAEIRNIRYQGSTSQKGAPHQKPRERVSPYRPLSPAQRSSSSKMYQQGTPTPNTCPSLRRDKQSSETTSPKMSQTQSLPTDQKKRRPVALESSRRTKPTMDSQRGGHSAEMRNTRHQGTSSRQGAPQQKSRERTSTHRPVIAQAQKSSSSKMYPSRTTTPSTGSSDKKSSAMGSSRMSQMTSSLPSQDQKPDKGAVAKGSSRNTRSNRGSQERGGYSAESRNIRYQGSSSQKGVPQQKSRESTAIRRPVLSPAQKSTTSKMYQRKTPTPSTGSSDKKSGEVASSRMKQSKSGRQDVRQKGSQRSQVMPVGREAKAKVQGSSRRPLTPVKEKEDCPSLRRQNRPNSASLKPFQKAPLTKSMEAVYERYWSQFYPLDETQTGSDPALGKATLANRSPPAPPLKPSKDDGRTRYPPPYGADKSKSAAPRGKYTPDQLRVNIDEVLNLGRILERHGLRADKQRAFDWLALNRGSEREQGREFARNLALAIGDLTIAKQMYSEILDELVEYSIIDDNESRELYFTLSSNEEVTIGRFAMILRSRAAHYRR